MATHRTILRRHVTRRVVNPNDVPDQPEKVMEHAGRFKDGKALLILGGFSAQEWESLRDDIKPDVILGANGVNAMVNNLDYWMCAENMARTKQLADTGDQRSAEFWDMFIRDAGAKVKLISHWSWYLLKDTSNSICIRREGYDRHHILPEFNFRTYGKGLLNGWVFKNAIAGRPLRVGTVAAQLMHFAGILGVREIHTIGLDLIFHKTNNHHAYQYPIYQPDFWRRPGMFINHKGAKTQRVWLETAQFFADVEPYLERDGIIWRDHSNGLLQIERLKCTL